MGITLKKTQGKATVSKETKSQGQVVAEETTDEAVEMQTAGPITHQPLCEVGVESSYTHNLGNYQSARIAVSLKMPCPVEQIDEVFDYANGWVEGKMKQLYEEMTAEA